MVYANCYKLNTVCIFHDAHTLQNMTKTKVTETGMERLLNKKDKTHRK